MTDDQKRQLETRFPVLVQPVNRLMSRGKTLDEAWLIAGAIYSYTGIASIPGEITDATNTKDNYPKVVGTINNYLRGKIAETDELRNLLALFEGINLLPDWDAGSKDPTRMMDAYPDIERDYKVGNVLLMAEVGSVSRNKPAPGMYQHQYRLHFVGGLKDITAINPDQQEVIYAPGSAYLVESRQTGKVKEKKGNQAHEHIHLRYVTPESDEYRNARLNGKLFDLRDQNRHANVT
jgi:hypothetical protein